MQPKTNKPNRVLVIISFLTRDHAQNSQRLFTTDNCLIRVRQELTIQDLIDLLKGVIAIFGWTENARKGAATAVRERGDGLHYPFTVSTRPLTADEGSA